MNGEKKLIFFLRLETSSEMLLFPQIFAAYNRINKVNTLIQRQSSTKITKVNKWLKIIRIEFLPIIPTLTFGVIPMIGRN